MKKIIVTVKDSRDIFMHDMEIPVDVPMELVIKKMMDNLILLYRSMPLFQRRFRVICSRTGKAVSPHKTADESGIRNGDYLIFSEE